MVTKTLSLAAKTAVELRAYHGNKPWDLIKASRGYDANWTAQIDPNGCGHVAYYVDGSHLIFDFSASKFMPHSP